MSTIYINISLIIILSIRLNAQELIQKSDFENLGKFDKTVNLYKSDSKPWFLKGYVTGKYIIENNSNANILPHSGRCMIQLRYQPLCPVPCTGCTGYLYCKTIHKLEVGKYYQINVWVYPTLDEIIEKAIFNNIGIFVSNKYKELFVHELLYPPSFFKTELVPGRWNEIKVTIMPLCEMDHVFVGVFKSDIFPRIHRRNIDGEYLFYIDDVSIIEIDELKVNRDEVVPYCPYPKELIINNYREDTLNILFASGDSTLNDDEKKSLIDFNTKNKNSGFAYNIVGYADKLGRSHDNQNLSVIRANSVKHYMITELNIPEYRIISSGKGEVFSNFQKAELANNRRVDVFVDRRRTEENIYSVLLHFVKESNFVQAYKYLNIWLNEVNQKQKIFCLFDLRLANFLQGPKRVFILEKVRFSYRNYSKPAEAFFWDSLYCEDQKYRTLDANISSLSSDESVHLYNCELNKLEYFDSIIVHSIEKYFLKYYLPKLSNLGYRASSALFNILSHSEDTLLIDRYLPYINNLCKDGEAVWTHYIMLVDKNLILKHQPQIYGSQLIYKDEKKNSIILAPCDDIILVNERRRKLGLMPVDEHVLIHINKG